MFVFIKLFEKEQFASQGGFPKSLKAFRFTTELRNASFELGNLTVFLGALLPLKGGVTFNVRDQVLVDITILPDKARIFSGFEGNGAKRDLESFFYSLWLIVN
ncbi:Unknown protein sequence [Pseudomonas syringae pv. maculicola]|nr:Unknown protein sequence [Pseudomonas syringae pv. maculicola]